MREQSEFYVEQGTLADAADDGDHAVAGFYIEARLRAIFLVENHHRISYGGGQRRQFVAYREIAQCFTDFA